MSIDVFLINSSSHFSGTNKTFIANFLKKYAKNVVFNSSPVQDFASEKCGEYCVAFLLFRIFNIDMTYIEALNSFFTCDLSQNEKKVLDFISEDV